MCKLNSNPLCTPIVPVVKLESSDGQADVHFSPPIYVKVGDRNYRVRTLGFLENLINQYVRTKTAEILDAAADLVHEEVERALSEDRSAAYLAGVEKGRDEVYAAKEAAEDSDTNEDEEDPEGFELVSVTPLESGEYSDGVEVRAYDLTIILDKEGRLRSVRTLLDE